MLSEHCAPGGPSAALNRPMLKRHHLDVLPCVRRPCGKGEEVKYRVRSRATAGKGVPEDAMRTVGRFRQ